MCNIYDETASSGFTLVELMITIFISSLLTVAFYGTYIMQRTSYAAQGQVAEMQQNIRAGIDTMMLDLRLAGYDPEGTAITGANIITAARPDAFSFAADMDEDGVLGTTGTPATESEYFAYDFYTAANGVSTLGRATSVDTPIAVNLVSGSHYEAAGHQPVADFIEMLEFAYVLDDGSVVGDATASGDHANIRAVRVSILARSKNADSKYTNTNTYHTALGTDWDSSPGDGNDDGFGDGFRRRFLITQIDLRNAGL
jgi:type IV pilus assembly protein PilW